MLVFNSMAGIDKRMAGNGIGVGVGDGVAVKVRVGIGVNVGKAVACGIENDGVLGITT